MIIDGDLVKEDIVQNSDIEGSVATRLSCQKSADSYFPKDPFIMNSVQ